MNTYQNIAEFKLNIIEQWLMIPELSRPKIIMRTKALYQRLWTQCLVIQDKFLEHFENALKSVNS